MYLESEVLVEVIEDARNKRELLELLEVSHANRDRFYLI